MSRTTTCFSLMVTMLVAQATIAHADFTSYVIREGVNAPVIQPNDDHVIGATEFIISESGQKAGWGTSDIDGITIGDITNVSITRYDDTGRFTAGSGPAVAPYFNIWVTNGLGQYAVLANEPSNPAFQSLFVDNMDGSKTYDLSYGDLADKVVKVYETPGWNTNTSWVHTLFGTDPLTFSDVASLTIEAPSADYITNGANGVGTGAPRELGTNVAYGFTWVFGDTLAHYVSGEDGYIVGSPSAVPEPTGLAIASLSLLGVCSFVRRWRNR